ncbi:sodium-translocating pyrophosphatase [Marichromatium sp. AB31]|uniref:sodium-translocating pyrophosphatase n=1 Tax=Marichromatium sp. AB31 TaxID=2483362 RepID=UPI000F3DB511|nr:sodium-translocating pyrophosphatase [Marichromatium sp. AB31]MBO8085674.1 sodium-translocating pyrophosphatase [Marichromatium sp.]RNE90645.1 sodium-translocating pyrophosphatase [Marichromatium sp. AB31]
MNEIAFWIAPVAALTALVVAARFFREMLAEEQGNARMREIGDHVRHGAMAYLRQQYRLMLLVFALLTALFALLSYGFGLQSTWLPATFVCGGLFSALAGYIGMQTATRAATRTAAAARTSLPQALRIAFRSGAVMGLVVVGLGLGNIVVWFALADWLLPAGEDAGVRMVLVTTTVLTFGMGASMQALFARVGGGIFTKAADVGADLVGKVESGIPEDDPRNPAVIADNVGDNVGDVAGMGADLFESYCGSILAACALGAAAYVGEPTLQIKAVVAPIAIAGLGVLLSILGVFLVRTREGADQRALLGALSRGVNAAAALIVVASALLLWALGVANPWGIWGAVVSGLLTGIVVGRATEYYTSPSYAPTLHIAQQAEGGPATAIIAGIGVGMLSTAVPILAVGAGTLVAFLCASGFDPGALNQGLYGVAIAAVGMLSTLGITLASDAYGPIADNAGGNAEMSGLGPEVRARTDALDALGNTTAATGKGFAIGSAALTALALIASYVEVVRIELIRTGVATLELGHEVVVATAGATLADFMTYFDVTLLNPAVLVAVLLGAMVAFVFSGLTVQAVGRAAGLMVEEVRRQFRADPGILAGTSEPDYERCVAISTLGAQREMLVPALIAVSAPVAVSLLLGVAGVIGLLVGGLSSGFVLAVFLSNSGGAWDNAKKYIEAGHHGGKNSRAHRASVIGDTVGDPFKDTSGPSLNILVKLMSVVAIVMAGVSTSHSLL